LDSASVKSGSVVFQGTVDGSMWTGSPQSIINGVDSSKGGVQLQVGFTEPMQQSLQLGNHLYKISIAPFNFQYYQSLTGVTLPVVTPYQNVPINVQVSDVPEPSTLALAAIGLAGLGVRACRRRRCSPHRQPGP
jgi:hypothetical protein